MSDMDRILRNDARVQIADEGFTSRVLGTLPSVPARSERTWWKPVLVMGSAALGSGLAVALSPVGTALLSGFQDLMYLRTGSQPAIAGLAICCALLVSALVLAFEE